MAATLTAAVLATGSAAASLTATATGTLPANIAMTAEVINRHSTPASLSTMGVTSPNATWVLEGTRTEGGGSAQRRITRYRTLVAADQVSEVVTATALNGIAQTEVSVKILYVPGADPGGTNGSNAIVQTVGADSGGASQTSLNNPITVAAGDGVLVTFVSGTASSITPRTGYTEIHDAAGTAFDVEIQYRANPDPSNLASASGSNNTWCSLASELKPLNENKPTPVSVCQITASGLGVGGIATGGVIIKAGKVYYANATVKPGNATPATAVNPAFTLPNGDTLIPGFSQQTIHTSTGTGGNPRYAQAFRLQYTGAVDISLNIQVTVAGVNTNWGLSFQIFEIGNVDTTQGTQGEISNTSGSSAGSSAVSLANTFAKATNYFFMLICSDTTTLSPSPGWSSTINTLIGGGNSQTCATERVTAPSPATTATTFAAGWGAVVVELAPLIIPSPPTVTLVTPGNGSTVTQTASVTMDVVDADGDLSNVAIYENGTPVFTGGAFQTGYLSSTKTSLGSGNFRFVVTPTAWTPGSLGIFVQAQDARGLIGTALFNFTVSAPATHAPTWTLVSPSNGSTIGQSDPIVIESNDLDDDLVSVLATFNVGGTDELAHGVSALDGTAFGSLYVTSSTVAGTAHGKRYTFRRSGGWTLGALSFDGTAADAVSNSTPVHYAWTVGGGGGGGGGGIQPIDVLGPGGLLFQVDERTAVVWHLDEPDGVQPSDAAGNVNDLAGVGTLTPPLRAAGIVGHGRKWAAGNGLGAKDFVAGATRLTRTMAAEVIVYPNGDGVRTLVQRGLNDGTGPEAILWALKLTVSGGTGTLQMAWQRAGGGAATVPGVSFDLPPPPPPDFPWIYVAAVRRWIAADEVGVDYYVNGVPVGSTSSSHGDIADGGDGTVLVGVTTSTPTSGMVVGDVIDEIRISNGERTAEEIRQVFRRLFVYTGWGRAMARSFLPPGTAYSQDPTSVVQREVAVEGDGMAHAWHLVDTLLDDYWPDRATQTLERWEGITRQEPHPSDFYADRRQRVVSHLSTVAGFSRPKILDAIAPLLDCLPTDLQVIEHSNRFEDVFAGSSLAAPWFTDAGGGAVSVSTGSVHLSFASGHDCRWDGTHETAARARIGLDAWSSTEIRTFLSAATLANTGDIAGIFAWNSLLGDAHLFGVRWNGSALEFAHVGILAGVATLTSFVGAVPATPYLRMRNDGAGNVELSYATAGWDGPWTVVGSVAAAPVIDWSGLFLSSGGASPASASSAVFDEFRSWMPESVNVYLWYVFRDPILGGNPDFRTAQALLEVLAPAHTLGVIFGTLFLTDDPNSLTDNDILGS